MASDEFSFKLIVMGDTCVGKTSLISVYTDDRFERQAVSTVAPASCSSVVPLEDGRNVELQIWDTAGQERFQSISQMFYRDSHIAFVCYDSTTSDTVENWIAKVRDEVPECIIFLVSTKADLLDSEQQEQCKAAGKKMMDEFNAKYHVLTSASTGTGVKELFTLAARCVDQVYLTNQPSVEINTPQRNNGGGSCC